MKPKLTCKKCGRPMVTPPPDFKCYGVWVCENYWAPVKSERCQGLYVLPQEIKTAEEFRRKVLLEQ